MSSHPVSGAIDQPVPIDTRFMTKAFHAFLTLAFLSAAIGAAGQMFGHTISKGGHSDSPLPRDIVVADNVIEAAENTIRFADARKDGVASRLDLYLRWPQMDGYSDIARSDFNHDNGSRRIIFLTFEERTMSRDMSGRYEPIYRTLIEAEGKRGPWNATLHDFLPKSGYLNEVLAVEPRAGGDPLVARCLSGEAAAQSLAPCERDIHLGENLSLTYRFPTELLAHWPKLEAAIRGKAAALLKKRVS